MNNGKNYGTIFILEMVMTVIMITMGLIAYCSKSEQLVPVVPVVDQLIAGTRVAVKPGRDGRISYVTPDLAEVIKKDGGRIVEPEKASPDLFLEMRIKAVFREETVFVTKELIKKYKLTTLE